AFREEQLREYQHRRSGIDVEIEELDGGADQAGGQHAARGIGRGGGGGGDSRRHRINPGKQAAILAWPQRAAGVGRKRYRCAQSRLSSPRSPAKGCAVAPTCRSSASLAATPV